MPAERRQVDPVSTGGHLDSHSSTSPRVSVIVPLYNSLALTQEMLASLRATLPSGLTHEIIFVDDGSTDGTRDWLAALNDPVIRVVLNERNMGFAASNNRGVALACGEFLALLNNDLVLMPGWIEPMLAVFDDPSLRAGIVGNLQHRMDNGALDHAGIVVTPQGKLSHIRELPEHAKGPREVFAVTAACCLLKRDDFLAAGGFDEGFVNGGEDVDLALKLRVRGKRAIVATGSVVRHHVSAARGPTSLRDEQNSRRLFQRWPSELEHAIAAAWAEKMREPAPSWFKRIASLFHSRGFAPPLPLQARLLARSALFREEARWQSLFDGAPDPLATAPASGFSLAGFSPVAAGKSAWLRNHSTVLLPAGFPRRNFFLSGYLKPVNPAHPEVTAPFGLRVTINGVQTVECFPLPEGSFNFGIDAPASLPDRPTRIDIALLGARRANFAALLGSLVPSPLLPSQWRAKARAYRWHWPQRRLRIARIVADDRTIFDFSQHPPNALTG